MDKRPEPICRDELKGVTFSDKAWETIEDVIKQACDDYYTKTINLVQQGIRKVDNQHCNETSEQSKDYNVGFESARQSILKEIGELNV